MSCHDKHYKAVGDKLHNVVHKVLCDSVPHSLSSFFCCSTSPLHSHVFAGAVYETRHLEIQWWARQTPQPSGKARHLTKTHIYEVYVLICAVKKMQCFREEETWAILGFHTRVVLRKWCLKSESNWSMWKRRFYSKRMKLVPRHAKFFLSPLLNIGLFFQCLPSDLDI